VPLVPQVLSAEQSVDWWGTVRGRIGWLTTPDLLLFGTAGAAYGSVSGSATYRFLTTVPGAAFGLAFPDASFECAPNVPCFTGSRTRVQVGWTAGGGVEWRLSRNWSVKTEYLYVNLGRQSVTATAVALNAAALTPRLSSFEVDLGYADFHVARIGVNYRF
jgi:outer membrane immunogenic protein